MKAKKPQSFKMQLLLFTLLICSSTQAQNWRLGGNTNFPLADNITAPGANRLGSQASFSVPINFITNGIQRMFINGGTNNSLFANASNAGYISIGNTPAAVPLFNLNVLTAAIYKYETNNSYTNLCTSCPLA